MAWQTPKTNWTSADGVSDADMNRIEGNIALLRQAANIQIADAGNVIAATNVENALQELYGNTVTGKGKIASALAVMNQTASSSDTYDTLANKIKAISTDADAAVGNVLSGKTFYQGGAKRTGTMPNRGAYNITPGTSNIAIPAGYHNGSGYVVGDPDLVTDNIKAGANIFGVAGKTSVVDTVDATAVAGDILSGKTAYVNGSKLTGTMPNRGAYNITPGVNNITIPAGYHNGAGVVYGDPDLVAANIKSGVNIFGVVGTVQDITITPSDNIRCSADTEQHNFFLTDYRKVKEITVNITGTIRVYFELMIETTSNYYAYGRIYKNGVAIGTERSTNSTTYVAYSEDIAVSAGDKIQLYVKATQKTYLAMVRNFRLKYDTGRDSVVVLD